MSEYPERMAPEGKVWVCGVCGKTAKDRYGMEGEHHPGWDESCAVNSALCDETKLVKEKGRVVRVLD